MSTVIPEERLEEMGLELPEPPPLLAEYVGLVRTGNLVFVSGHTPYENGGFAFKGKLGRDMDAEAGAEAARLTTMNLLATLREELGSLDRVVRVVKLLIMVNSDVDFVDQSVVANGASRLLVDVFGQERGRHARSAVGMGALPFGIPVEIEGIFEVR